MDQRQTHKRTMTLSKIRWCTTENIHFSFPPKSVSFLVSCISGKFLLALSLQSALSLSKSFESCNDGSIHWNLVMLVPCVLMNLHCFAKERAALIIKNVWSCASKKWHVYNKEQCSHIEPVPANILHITSCWLNCFTQ